MAKDNLFANRTLWLDREHMVIARERFWEAFRAGINAEASDPSHGLDNTDDKRTWDVAWAAAIAAYSFCAEGNLGPRGEDSEST